MTPFVRAIPLALALQSAGALAALDIAGIDPAIDPCRDFPAFANHKWQDATPIPGDRTVWGTFSIVDANNEKILVAALDAALREKPAAGTARRKAVDYYASGLDLEAIEKAGLKPLAPLFERIDKVSDAESLARTLGELHARGLRAGFSFGVRQDVRDSEHYLAEVSQGGLGLPDREYYFDEDARARTQREAYVKHVARMLELSGTPAEQAAKDAAAILTLEAELAKASTRRADLRDPEKNYHKMTLADLQGAAQFPWAAYFRALGAPSVAQLNVHQPSFMARFAALAQERPAAEWRAYLRWHVLRDAGSKLGKAIAAEAFDFQERTLVGRQVEQPRFRKVLEIVSGRRGSEPMGQAYGELFVERAFPPQAKVRALELVANLKAALADRLRGLEWMGGETRARALEKLAAMQVKIGYPDAWRDYSDARVGGDRVFVENWMEAQAFEVRRQLRRIGERADRAEWWMGPQAVNAYYSGANNEIVFPAGILQPPFFDAKADDAANYGGIGAVIGHEITHGFDDRGRKFDAKGNLHDWWTEADARNYASRTQKIVRQYSEFEGPEGIKVNGRLTLGENIADIGGVKIAYLALQKALAAHPQEKIDGLTPQQRFFLSFAQIWRSSMRPEQERLLIKTDPHSPARYRIKGPLANLPEFARAFSCDAKTALLAEEQRAYLW